MSFIKRYKGAVVKSLFAAAIVSTLITNNAIADDEAPVYAFPDAWKIRMGAYVVDGSDTKFSASPFGGAGIIIDYQKDLGGEDGDTIPRIDAHYRFNERHRIDFTAFSIDRKGTRTLTIDATIEGKEYQVGETIDSQIKYTLYRLGYGYSFYHSPKVELTLTAGLNITSYDLNFALEDGSNAESAGVTVPLPVFGLRMGYAITPKWSVNYVSEAFFIELDDSFRGSILNYELNTEYRLFKNFALGVGFARIGVDAEIDDDDWRGTVTDAYRGYNIFGTFYF